MAPSSAIFVDGDALEVHGGGAGDDVGRDGVMDLAEGLAGDAHLLDLGGGFDHDGHRLRCLVLAAMLGCVRRRCRALR